MLSTIRLLLVNEEELMLDAVTRLLETFPEFRIVATAGDAPTALEKMTRYHPHVVVLDLPASSSAGLEMVREMRRSNRFVKVVILASNQQPAYMQEAFLAGANAYLSRRIDAVEFRRLLNVVYHEGAALGSGMAAHVLQWLAGRSASSDSSSPVSFLTERERQILFMIAEDCPTGLIARQLGISPKTVRNYCSSIYSKLGTLNRIQTTLYAKRHFGLLHDPPVFEASVDISRPRASADRQEFREQADSLID